VKRFGRLIVLAMLTASLMVPGLSGTASAQGSFEDLCNEAQWEGEGETVQGYEVVEFTGGAGSQIVLGYGDVTLSGGSGNDILCAWGTGNTLDGGSGNDVLVAMDSSGNAFYGGSGNDTMIGYVDDYFDGGSGRNTPVRRVISTPDLLIGFAVSPGDSIYGSGFQPGAVQVDVSLMYDNVVRTFYTVYPVADVNGAFLEEPLPYYFCNQINNDTAVITATDGSGIPYTESFDLDCL